MTDAAAATGDNGADTTASEAAAAAATPVLADGAKDAAAAASATGGAATAALATQAAAAGATDAEIAAGIAKTEADEKAKALEAKSWLDGVEAEGDLKTWLDNKNFPDLTTALESYRKNEEMNGKKGLILPTGPDDKEGYERLNKALGVPDSPDGYKLPLPEGMDPAFSAEASKWFHESGLTPRQAQGVTEKWNAYADAKIKADQDAWNARSQVELADVQAEWGAKAPANMELAKRAAAQFGIDTDKSSAIERALGTRGYMELMHKIGSGLVEHSFEVGDTKEFSTTMAGAQARITQLAGDKEWSKSYLGGDKAKLAEMERLQKIAYPGESE